MEDPAMDGIVLDFANVTAKEYSRMVRRANKRFKKMKLSSDYAAQTKPTTKRPLRYEIY